MKLIKSNQKIDLETSFPNISYRSTLRNIHQLDLTSPNYLDLTGIIGQAKSTGEEEFRSKKLYSPKRFIQGIGKLNELKTVKYGFSTREFGNMAFKFGETKEVVSNRAKFAKAVGASLKNAVFMRPTHGANIEIVSSKDIGNGAFSPGTNFGPADGIITFDKGVALGLNSADCVPIIVTSKNKDVLALIHAGRTGTNAQITKIMIKKLISLGVNPKELIVGIGPSIQKACYKLEFLETTKPNQWLPWVTPYFKQVKIKVEKVGKTYRIQAEKGKLMVDVIGLNIRQLIDAGVNPENIEVAPVCSYCLAKQGEMFSHQLSSQYNKSRLFPEGRFMVLAMLS